MDEIPFAMGCPIDFCPVYVEVSEEDPDASQSELLNHIRRHTADLDQAYRFLTKAVMLTEAQAVAR